MGFLKDLPYEVVLNILEKLLKQSKIHEQWHFVNGLFYNYGRPSYYRQVNFRFEQDVNDDIMDALQHSPFNPGQWVQKVVLDKDSVPANWRRLIKLDGLEDYNLSLDPLYQFSQLCPNVKEVIADSSGQVEQACMYFYFILAIARTSLWKLQHAPTVENVYVAFRTIFSLHDSLLDLTINTTLKDYSLLSRFKHLISLTILEDVHLKSIFDVEKFLKYTPLLENLQVSVIELDEQQETYKSQILSEQHIYPRIMALNINCFQPNSDRDFQFITQSFPALERLNIAENSMTAADGNYRRLPIIAFFEHLFTIKEFKIRDKEGNPILVDSMMAARNYHANKTAIASKLEIISVTLRGEPEEMLLTYSNGALNARWYSFPDTWIEDLSLFLPSFDTVEIDLTNEPDNIGEFLPVLFYTRNSIVKNLKFSSGSIMNYRRTSWAVRYHLTSLEFVGVEYIGELFHHLSDDIESIDRLSFTGTCTFMADLFQKYDKMVDITMLRTKVNTLTICNWKTFKSKTIFLSIFLLDKGPQKYYMWQVKKNTLQEITADHYKRSETEYEEAERYSHFNICFESLNHLVIRESKESDNHLYLDF